MKQLTFHIKFCINYPYVTLCIEINRQQRTEDA